MSEGTSPDPEIDLRRPGETVREAVDRRVGEILALAHSDKPQEKREYQRLQPELVFLIERQSGK